MNAVATTKPKAIMDIIVNRTMAFFESEMDITVDQVLYSISDVQRLELRFMTSLMSVSGGYNMFLAFSFEEPLIRQMYDIYTSDVEVEPGEEDTYLEETAADVINMIVGNSTADFASGDCRITLSPPVVISHAKRVFRNKQATFYTAMLETNAGRLEIMCIGPMELFDEQLNYKEQ